MELGQLDAIAETDSSHMFYDGDDYDNNGSEGIDCGHDENVRQPPNLPERPFDLDPELGEGPKGFDNLDGSREMACEFDPESQSLRQESGRVGSVLEGLAGEETEATNITRTQRFGEVAGGAASGTSGLIGVGLGGPLGTSALTSEEHSDGLANRAKRFVDADDKDDRRFEEAKEEVMPLEEGTRLSKASEMAFNQGGAAAAGAFGTGMLGAAGGAISGGLMYGAKKWVEADDSNFDSTDQAAMQTQAASRAAE